MHVGIDARGSLSKLLGDDEVLVEEVLGMLKEGWAGNVSVIKTARAVHDHLCTGLSITHSFRGPW